MGKRSFISMTAINRMISASNNRKKEEERINLINSQSGTRKELNPTYSITNIDFNIETRSTKIEFLQSQQYRTIDRYVTQNHVRYPIYSTWKTRTKTIKKTIILTNQELESLKRNSEPLIRSFAEDIILRLGNEDLIPSWFIHEYLEKEYSEKVQKWENERSDYYKITNLEIEKNKKLINEYNTEISKANEILSKITLKRHKLNTKIQKIESTKKSITKSILSLFLFNYFKSATRKQKLFNKKIVLNEQIAVLEKSIQQKSSEIEILQNNIQTLRNDYSKKQDELDALKKSELSILSDKLAKIEPLPYQISDNTGFIPLKSFIGFAYEKIIGCYIIHNKEKNKYYVGQSKDVVKRIKQHFKGTAPNNVVFAEDYYSTSLENRENLFELKIMKCETKDELDRLEKQLIEDYDAFNSGYNATNGNN